MAFVDLRFLQYPMISYGVGFVLEELDYMEILYSIMAVGESSGQLVNAHCGMHRSCGHQQHQRSSVPNG